MKKILSLVFASVFALSLSAQVYYLLPNSAEWNSEAVNNVYDNPSSQNQLQWETSEGNVPQVPERKAYEWFKDTYNSGAQKVITYKDLTDGRLAANGNLFGTVKVVWVYVDRWMTKSDFDALFPEDVRAALANYVKAGGNLYLSTFATRLVWLMGRTTQEPGFSEYNGFGGCNEDDPWPIKAHAFRDEAYNIDNHEHAIYKYLNEDNQYVDNYRFNMQSGTLRTNRNCVFDQTWDNAESQASFESNNVARVLAGWGHEHQINCAGLVEFYPKDDWKGTIITNGLAACSWAACNQSVNCVKLLTKGVLDYLSISSTGLAWNEETVPESGVINSTHIMTAHANAGFNIAYTADEPTIANIGIGDGNIYYNYFGNAIFKATATGDGWTAPKSTKATINSAEIPVTGGNQTVTYAYVLPYSLHTMYNYDNEDGKRPDFESANWFYQQFIIGNVGGEHGCFVRPSDLASLDEHIKVLWIHNDHVGLSSADYYNDLGGDTFRDNLTAFVNGGGHVFVSKQATRLIGDLGRDNYPRYANSSYANRDAWRVGNKWNFENGGEIDRSTHRVFSGMGTNTTIMAAGSHTDNNCVWHQDDGVFSHGSNDAQRLTQYESDHNCVILGAWGHYNNAAAVSPIIECVGFVEYNPTAAGHGIIIAMGLASYHWANPTNEIKTLTLNTLSYLNFMNARPCALDNSTPMETKLAENGFYPSETQSFLKLHPVCENMAATYTLTSNPNNIARIQKNVQVGEETITQLQFKAAGTVTLHIVLTETRTNVNWPTGTYEYDREITFSYPYDSPRASDNTAMADKLADAYFYPANTTTFRTLHPVCEGIGATYTLTDPNNIARIQEDVQVGEETITQLQFQSAGTVTLHVTLTEEREYMYWPTGVYNYDREITFAYANANAAQDAVNADLSSNGFSEETIEQEIVYMAMRLHPSIRGLDSLSYTITNHHDATQGEAYKKTEDGVTRLYFTKSGKVLLTVRMNEPNWREEWTPGEKELTHVVEFNYSHETGPDFPWPSEFETGAVGPNSVITLPATVGGLAVTYTVEGNASLSGNVLTLADVESGSVDVHASITETVYKTDWPMGTYNYDNSLSFHAAEVGYLLPAAESIDHMAGWYEGEQPEYNAATWFQDNYIATGKGRFVTVEELPTLFDKGIKTLWVNIERIGIDNENGLLSTSTADDAPKCATRLETYVKAGGNVLLTKQATRLAYLMDRIAYAPEFNAGGYSTDVPAEHRSRSIATKMGTGENVDEALDMSEHRLYNDMLSYDEPKNIYLVAPGCNKTMNYCSWQDFFTDGNSTHAYDNAHIQRLKDFENAWHATVFGIQGNIGDYCLSNIIEFNAMDGWAGRILTIGSAAYQWGSSNNDVERENLTKLTANALAYLQNEEVEEEVYTRDIPENMFGTICWGYDVEAGKIAGAEIYELTSFNATGDGVILTEVNSMIGGRAYFFLGTSNQLRLTYTGQKKEAEVGGHNGLVGYIPLTGNDPLLIEANTHNYILYNDQLLFVDSEIHLPAHRAYVNYNAIPAYQSEAPAGVRRRVVTIDRHDMPTDVENVEIQPQQGTYDIMGRKLSAPQGVGFYIINGKKAVITH